TPTDFIVQTQLIDPTSNQPPAEVDFRVRTDTGKPVLVDVAYQGIWLSLEQRDQFVAFLGQNNGNFRSLVAHLSDLAVNLGKPANLRFTLGARAFSPCAGARSDVYKKYTRERATN